MKRLFNVALLFLLPLFFITNTAHAFPLTSKNFGEQYLPLQDFNFGVDKNYDYEGIVALSNCSGSLVRFEFSQDADQAMVLTNGHCFENGLLNPNTFVSNVASNRTFTLLTADGRNAGQVKATRVIYATMTRTDIALYRVNQTYQQIKSQMNIRPLTLTSSHPEVGNNIQVLSGYWRRGYECSITHFVNELREDNWTFSDSLRYSETGCNTIHGTSGSPVIQAGTRLQIGIHNTGNDDGEACTFNNPCEVDEKGNLYYKKGLNYGQETYWIYSCIRKDLTFDLNQEGCLLYH